MKQIIILIIIILFLCIILFIALNKLIESIKKDSQSYYFKTIQDLDSKILEKQKMVDSLDESDNKESNKDIKRIEKETNIDKELLDIIKKTDYANFNALKIASKVDEIFQIDEEKVIKDFLSKVEINEDYDALIKMYDRFSPNLIYKLKSLNTSSQIKEISKMLSDKEYVIFNAYLDKYKFKLEKFILDLSLLIENAAPCIEISVGQKNKNYDYLSKYIKTVYNEDIYKGIIIKYRSQVYDYSINERRA